MNTEHLVERDVESIYIPNTIYGIGGGGKEAVLQLFEEDWFAIEVMRDQSGTTNVYLVDTTTDEGNINRRITERQQELNEIRDHMREMTTGQQIGGINLEAVEVTKGLKTDRASALTGRGSVPDILETTRIDHWWLDRQDLIEPGTKDLYDFSKGACRCRAIGKAFHYKALAEGEDRGYELNYSLPGDDDKVAIIAGLGGGTGSGLVIDIAKQLYEQHQARRITLFATLPTRKEQVKERANAFAALSELEFQAFTEEDDIFDNIVLFPLQPLDPDIEVQDQELIELDRAMAYVLIGYYNAGHYDDAVNQAPSYAPFTIALPQIFRYDIEGIVEAKNNAIETVNRKIEALNAEYDIYDRLIRYVDENYADASEGEIKRNGEDMLKRRIEFMRELVELPLFDELEFESAQETGRKLLNTVYDADETEGETYADKTLEVAFAENDLDNLLERELRFFFKYEYKDIDVGSDLDPVEELDDETIKKVVLAEAARLQDKYRALKAVSRIPSSKSSDESNRKLAEFLLKPTLSGDESARVNAVEKHRDEILDELGTTRDRLKEVTEEIERELDVQKNLVRSEVDNWESAVADDLETHAELGALKLEDDLVALENALESFATKLHQNKAPPSGEEVKDKLDQLRERLEDIDAVDFQNKYDHIWQQVDLAKQLRHDWNTYQDAQDRNLTERLNPLNDTVDEDSAKKELRATIVNLSENVFTTSHLGPNETNLDISVTYDPRAEGELVDEIRKTRRTTNERIVDEFERRLQRIAEEEGSGSYQMSVVDQFRDRLQVIDSPSDLRRERENLVAFVNQTYKETASEDLPELESRRGDLEQEIESLETRKEKFDALLDLYRDLRDKHDTFTSKHEAFTEDLNRQAERFGTRAFAEYQPNQHYIHKYMPQDTRRAIEKRSIAETDLFQKDWDQNERGRLQDFTSEIVKRRAAAPDYTGLRERDFGNRDFDFTGARIHVAKISEAIDASGSDKAKLWIEDLGVKESLGDNYYLDESGQARRMFEQWATENGGPWDVGLTFFIQGLGFLDNLRDMVEKRGYQDGYEARKREIHNIALHHSYGLEQGFFVRRREFVDPRNPKENGVFLDANATSIRSQLCSRLERVPLSDELNVKQGPPDPVSYRESEVTNGRSHDRGTEAPQNSVPSSESDLNHRMSQEHQTGSETKAPSDPLRERETTRTDRNQFDSRLPQRDRSQTADSSTKEVNRDDIDSATSGQTDDEQGNENTDDDSQDIDDRTTAE